MSSEPLSRRNHYVPVWYQKRFFPKGAVGLFLLDASANQATVEPQTNAPRAFRRRPPKTCFCETDLYTLTFGTAVSDRVERELFGSIDNNGATAVAAFAGGEFQKIHASFQNFFEYLSAQRLRTPKGLAWLKSNYPALSQLQLMEEMAQLRQMHCTMWVECVREIVSAKDSDVKFIVTDHPVTIYNPAAPPGSAFCRYPNDPSFALNGSQTIFALDADHCLILTHIDYAKNPIGVDLLATRKNARTFGSTIARTDAFIRKRRLSREDVIAINYILKARARRYVAADRADWLSTGTADRDWAGMADVLRPPQQELFGFGGEMYVGYKDGTTHYQDQYGRTSDSHKYLQKKPAESLDPNDPCGCGSGRAFSECCADIPLLERPPWDVLSARERNLMFGRAVEHILGLDEGKSWLEIRKGLADEQVARIHESYAGLWPEDTSIPALIPRPNARFSRVVFMGLVDPRTIASDVLCWLEYFDEIVLPSPFQNARHVRDEYSAIKSPEQHKSNTLKHSALLISLLPFIELGVVHLLPDPSDFNPAFRSAVLAEAQRRKAGWKPDEGDLDQQKKLAQDDLLEFQQRLPFAALVKDIEKNAPDIDRRTAKQVAVLMKRRLLNNPFALLQPIIPGEDHSQLLVMRGTSIELALFFCHMMGAMVLTDSNAYWKLLHSETTHSDGKGGSPWNAVIEALAEARFEVEWNPAVVLHQLYNREVSLFAKVFRSMFKSISCATEIDDRVQLASNIAADVRNAIAIEESRNTTCPPELAERRHRSTYKLAASIPKAGFELTTVRRLLLMFGRATSLGPIPIAFQMVEDKS